MSTRWISVSLVSLVVAACGGAQHHYKMKKSTVGTVVIPAPEASNNTAPPDPTNPFVGAKFYINPEYVKEVEDAAAAAPDMAATIKKVEAYPTATWLVMNSFVAKVPEGPGRGPETGGQRRQAHVERVRRVQPSRPRLRGQGLVR